MSVFTKPLYLLGPPMLLVVSIPLAVFACITTTFAISLLAIRVSVVYFELGVVLAHAYLFPEQPISLLKRSPPPPSLCSSPQNRRRHGSSSSQDTAVPVPRVYTKSGSSASLLGIGDLTRDFEGVGGWRFYEGEEEEALWMSMNKRLELPTAIPRRHQRRHTGEDQRWSWTPEMMRMSPVQSRTRTPTQATSHDKEGEEYFPPQLVLRPLSTASEPLSKSVGHSRRTSLAESPLDADIASKQAGE